MISYFFSRFVILNFFRCINSFSDMVRCPKFFRVLLFLFFGWRWSKNILNTYLAIFIRFLFCNLSVLHKTVSEVWENVLKFFIFSLTSLGLDYFQKYFLSQCLRNVMEVGIEISLSQVQRLMFGAHYEYFKTNSFIYIGKLSYLVLYSIH